MVCWLGGVFGDCGGCWPVAEDGLVLFWPAGPPADVGGGCGGGGGAIGECI